jgi:DNA-binding PadR family transcriptional regulator
MSTIDVSMADARDFLPLSPQQFQILLALSDADRHGYGIILEVETRTRGSLRLGTGTLYTALAGLVDGELIEDTDAPSTAAAARKRRDNGDSGDSRRRYYRLTPFGRTVLEAETARLDSLVRQARRKGVSVTRAALQPSPSSRGK